MNMNDDAHSRNGGRINDSQETPQDARRSKSNSDMNPPFDYPDSATRKHAHQEDAFAFELYAAIVRRLRAPDGCPWDRKQTLGSLRRHLVEEVFETVTAIDRFIKDHGDGNTSTDRSAHVPSPNERRETPPGVDLIREELGDTLLVAFLVAGVLEENYDVSIADIVRENGNKLIRRHPHVFGDVSVAGAEEVVANWSRIKKDVEGKIDDYHRVGSDLPPLLRAAKIQKRAAKHGFDWPDAQPAVKKIHEEADELLQDLNSSEPDTARLESEVGDLLFSVVNVARKLDIDPATALNRTNVKFADRLHYIQERLATQNMAMDDATLQQMDDLWNESKSSNG